MIIEIEDSKFKEIQNLFLENELEFNVVEDIHTSIHQLWLEHIINLEASEESDDTSTKYTALIEDIPFIEESIVEMITYNEKATRLFEDIYTFYKNAIDEQIEFNKTIE